MKKILFILLLLIVPLNVFASTKTYQRTEEDYRVYSYLPVTNENKEEILSTISVNEKEKVYDFGEVFEDEYENIIYNKIKEFSNKKDVDLVLLTINDLNGKSIEKYIDNFYKYNMFGQGYRYGCIFILIYDKKIYLYGFDEVNDYYDYLNGYYKDLKNNSMNNTETIINIITDLLKNNDYNEDESFSFLSKINTNSFNIISFIIISLVVALIITFCIMIRLILKTGLLYSDKGANDFFNDKTCRTNLISEDIIGSTINKNKRS